MTQPLASVSAAADYYRAEFAALDASFLRNGDGAACLRRRSIAGGHAGDGAVVAAGGRQPGPSRWWPRAATDAANSFPIPISI